MDHYSILDRSSPSHAKEPSLEADLKQSGAIRPQQPSVSAAIAAANTLSGTYPEPHPGLHSGPNSGHGAPLRFPGDDGGRSLAEIAERDLDAALQLLAERAQYITAASGAAIALRRSGQKDMLCRASAGSNAPELGALLSAEFGLSGESVRTRLALRCDDTERDPRVNREGCRQLGIASVVVMPIADDDEVLGVFELFSGKVNAFDDRDLSALRRLGEMVETAVKLAHAAGQMLPEIPGEQVRADEEPVVAVETDIAPPESKSQLAPAPIPPPLVVTPTTPPVVDVPAKPAVPKKPLLWSAALSANAEEAERAAEPDQSHVPPVLRNLHKCQACGFPVSEARVLCVDCEEKHWRGQLRIPQPAAPVQPLSASSAGGPANSSSMPLQAKAAAASTMAVPAAKLAVSPSPQLATLPAPVAAAATPRPATSAIPEPKLAVPDTASLPASMTEQITIPALEAPAAPPFLTSGMAQSESWLASHKYILGALLVVAVVVAVIVLVR
jgi:hypothetical protein